MRQSAILSFCVCFLIRTGVASGSASVVSEELLEAFATCTTGVETVVISDDFSKSSVVLVDASGICLTGVDIVLPSDNLSLSSGDKIVCKPFFLIGGVAVILSTSLCASRSMLESCPTVLSMTGSDDCPNSFSPVACKAPISTFNFPGRSPADSSFERSLPVPTTSTIAAAPAKSCSRLRSTLDSSVCTFGLVISTITVSISMGSGNCLVQLLITELSSSI